MDADTVAIYDRDAATYASRRKLANAKQARAFARAVQRGGWRLDLGCGPGFHLPLLGRPLVATDAAAAMLELARASSGDASLLQCDAARLPFRRGSLGGVWAHKVLQHMAAADLPAALGEVHRVLAVGAPLDLLMFEGDGTWVSDDEDDLPGRRFTMWRAADLHDVLVGAGFSIDATTVGTGVAAPIHVRATRERTLADTVSADMRLLVCGLNPSLYSADAGAPFARPGNRFWPAMIDAGLATRANDPAGLLARHRIGMTDVVKRATVAAKELRTDEYRAGLARIERLCARLEPAAVVFVGLAGWRAARDRHAVAGWQPDGFGPTPVYLMPSTSGLNAHSSRAELAEHLRQAAAHSPNMPGNY